MTDLPLGRWPLVSVVVPTFNRAGPVAVAIESVLRQTYARTEVIVIDDGSTDNTAQVVEDAQRTDVRVKYYRNVGAKGSAGARNAGNSKAAGEYVAYLDDDDVYLPDKIARQVDVLRAHPGVDVVVSGVPVAWCEPQVATRWLEVEFHPNLLFASCFVMCRRRVLSEVRFRHDYMEWRDLAFQVYDRGLVVHLAPERLALVKASPGSASRQTEAMLAVALSNAKCYCQSTRERTEHPVFCHYLANCEKNCGNYALKKGRVWTAARHYNAAYRAERRLRNIVPFV